MSRALYQAFARALEDDDRPRLVRGKQSTTGVALLHRAARDVPWPDDGNPAGVLVHCLSWWRQGRAVIVPGPTVTAPNAATELLMQEHFPSAALVVASSGSTGAPRQVVLSGRSVRHNLAAISKVLPAPGRMAGLSPMHHIYGLVGQLLWTIIAGGTFVAPTGRTALLRLRGVLAARPDGVQLVPSQLPMLLDLIDDGAVAPAWVASAGARVDAALWKRWRTVMPNSARYTQYGCTEAGPRLCTWRDDGVTDVPGLVGPPVPGVEMVVEDGKLWAMTPGAMSGTIEWGQGVATVATHEGRLPTGDVGAIDDEGRVIIQGRADAVINTGGVRVSPVAVEDALLQVPGIDAAVVGPMPSARLGQVVKAAIATRRDPDEVIAKVRAQLSGAMRPRAFCFWRELPTLGSGKVDRLAALKGPSDGEHP